jgi:hypothetical protein
MDFRPVIFFILSLGMLPAKVSFNKDIRQLLSNKCFHCHGPDEEDRKAKLRLDTREGALKEKDGFAAIVPGNIEDSEMIYRILSDDEDEVMPPPGKGTPFTKDEIELLKQWIKEGAEYEVHWSYQKPERPKVPEVSSSLLKIRTPVDSFILDRLNQEKLSPSREADRHTLIRRVSLDLTGLPPTPAEVEAFIDDDQPGAYERLVDRLLAKPAFGEHWARLWLDLARYADSAGYADDPGRTIWAYRDWVIRALNDNMPFDQFTIEQIAGDLLPNPTQDQLIATAFHRNTKTNNEGGTSDEEFRNAAVVDRVNTTMATWMGTTAACAQCHTHKYDPITHEEYFKIFAIFNQSEDADRRNEAPIINVMGKARKEQQASLQSRIENLQKDEPSKERDEKIKTLRKELAGIKPTTTVPVMRELPANKHRKTHIQLRGSYLVLGDEVTPGVPAVFGSLPEGSAPDRLALANWLISKDNPLTARVVANRFWENLFGVGIVLTSEEFGSQGERPSHPELLDWLAIEFMEQGWDMKMFLRLLVTSSVYRQNSHVTDELAAMDPDNRLLARGPRVRLTAEMIRDQALAVSGLLSTKMYGPPVRPPQPNLGLKAAFGGGTDWKTSGGEDKFRRGLYTSWRRSSPYPSMATFGAPNREVCTVRRGRTNTPLQALVTLNDPVYVEAAQALARRMAAHEGDLGAKLEHGFRLTLSRKPKDAELVRLIKLYEQTQPRYAADEKLAQQMATNPIGPIPSGTNVVDLATLTVVGNVLLNLDETLMKR